MILVTKYLDGGKAAEEREAKIVTEEVWRGQIDKRLSSSIRASDGFLIVDKFPESTLPKPYRATTLVSPNTPWSVTCGRIGGIVVEFGAESESTIRVPIEGVFRGDTAKLSIDPNSEARLYNDTCMRIGARVRELIGIALTNENGGVRE